MTWKTVTINDIESTHVIRNDDEGTVIPSYTLQKIWETLTEEGKNEWYTTTVYKHNFNASEVLDLLIRMREEDLYGYEGMTEKCIASIPIDKLQALQKALDDITTNNENFYTYPIGNKIIE